MIGLILRILRHALTPLVVYLVSAGLLPVELQGDIIEILLISVTAVAALGWSYLREFKIRGRSIADILKGPPKPD